MPWTHVNSRRSGLRGLRMANASPIVGVSCPELIPGDGFMDRITEGILDEFAGSFGIRDLSESERFAHLSTYVTVRRHFSETAFDPGDLVTGSGGDIGIDAIAIIANNNLITDKDMVDDLVEVNGYLDVAFVFVQATCSPKFDGAKIGQFGSGVRDFFGIRSASAQRRD